MTTPGLPQNPAPSQSRRILPAFIAALILFALLHPLTTHAATLTGIDLNGVTGANPSQLINLSGTLIFEATDGAFNSTQLWRSDGTVAGTSIITVINPEGIGVNNPSMAISSGTLFFSANDGAHGEELWKTTGTSTTTALVKDIYPGENSASPQFITNVAGTIFFAAYSDADTGLELWKSDGTAAGTTLVYAFNPTNSFGNSTIANLTAVNNTLFFTVTDPATGNELWKSDGTTVGTGIVKDIYPGNTGSTVASSFPNNLLDVSGTLYFFASGTNGNGLWQSDGSEAGTTLIAAVNGADLIAVSGTLFFDGNGELWKSDGTPGGTFEVKNILNGSADPEFLTNVNGTVFFTADDAVHGRELWQSDGTEAGTVLVDDINPGSPDSLPINDTAFDNALFFTADDGTHGRELWFSQGVTGETSIVADIDPNQQLEGPNVGPQWLTPIGQKLFFSADDNVHGYELWVLDTATPPPTAVTGTATSVGTVSAVLNGTVNPNGTDAIARFHFGTDTTYGTVTPTLSIGSGTTPVLVSATISGLQPSTPYHFEVTGSNGGGVALGGDMSFVTPAIPGSPTMVTGTATSLGTTTATLNGTANPNGEATTAYFQYGPDTNYGTITTATSVGAGSAPVSITFPLTGLQQGATYHYRAVGVNVTGTGIGLDQVFTTNANLADYIGKFAAVFSGGTNPTTGLASISISKTGAFTASVDNAGRKTSFTGKFTPSRLSRGQPRRRPSHHESEQFQRDQHHPRPVQRGVIRRHGIVRRRHNPHGLHHGVAPSSRYHPPARQRLRITNDFQNRSHPSRWPARRRHALYRPGRPRTG